MKKTPLIATLLLLLVFKSFSQNTNNVSVKNSIDSLILKMVSDKKIPGINFSIVYANGKIDNYAIGLSDIENKISLTTEHTFFSGSIGKTYTATLVFRLVESGKIDLHKKYIEYFPDLDWLTKLPNINTINVEMLLQHTSGLPRYVLKTEIWNQLYENPNKIWSYKDRLSVIFDDAPVQEAGKSWAYSDTNYILLGMLIEKITGENYYDLVTSTILKPNTLTSTYPSLQRKIPELAIGYSKMPAAFHVPKKTVNNGQYFINPQLEWTGGGMASTTSDLAKWAKIYYEGQLISSKSLHLITTPNPNGNHVEGTSSYGMGSFIYETKHGVAYGHTGFMPGFNSIVIYYPKLKIAAAIQINCDYAVSVLNINELTDNLISIATKY